MGRKDELKKSVTDAVRGRAALKAVSAVKTAKGSAGVEDLKSGLRNARTVKGFYTDEQLDKVKSVRRRKELKAQSDEILRREVKKASSR